MILIDYVIFMSTFLLFVQVFFSFILFHLPESTYKSHNLISAFGADGLTMVSTPSSWALGGLLEISLMCVEYMVFGHYFQTE
jgi:hypothetical protein